MTRRTIGVTLGWIGLSMAGDGIPTVLLPHQFLRAGSSSASMLGLTTLVAITAAALVQPVAGEWSDRIGRWPVITLGCVMAVTGLGLILDPSRITWGAIVALSGASMAQAAYQPLAPDWIPVAWRGRASGVKGALDVGGAFIGFLLLARLLGQGAVGAAVTLLAAGLVLPFALARIFMLRGRGPSTRPLDSIRPRSDSLQVVGLVIARFLVLVAIFAVGRFLLLFIADRFALTPDAAAKSAGGLLALLALLSAMSSLPAGWLADRVGRRSVMVPGGVLACVGIGMLPAASTGPSVLVAGALLAIGSGAFGAGSWALLTDLTSAGHAGRLMGLANFGTAGAAAAAGAFGPLIDAGNRWQPMAGYTLAFALAAAAGLIGCLLSWRVAPAASRDPALRIEVPS